MTEQTLVMSSRRRFTLSVLLTLATAGALGGCRLLPGTRPGWAHSQRLLATLAGDRDAQRQFGEAYLNDFPDEHDLDVLLARIDAALKLVHGRGLDYGDTERVLADLDRLVRDEFRRGEVVLVKRWMLSRSEARLYAALALH